jgi:L-threonylcarbamoyladenylate synthase
MPERMTELLQPSEKGVAAAAALLRHGALVAFGTETVYGLGADATNAQAVAAIFAAKGRPRFNPLICHYPSAAEAFAHTVADDRGRRLAETFWPGPLTLVLPRAKHCPVSLLAASGLHTLGVRVPRHPLALSLLRQAATPIAAPSANRSGHVSPTSAAHVLDDLDGLIAAVLDCGPCAVGVESTVLDISGPYPALLRPGGVTHEALEACIGPIQSAASHTMVATNGGPRSPGMMASHYAPVLPVRLAASAVSPDEALLAFGPPLSGAGCVFQLSVDGDTTEAAANLFEGLHWLDAEAERLGLFGRRLKGIAAMPIPERDLGRAINDRLQRAAAPRGAAGQS